MAHAWKVCIPQKGIMGSNPILSARMLFFYYNVLLLLTLKVLDFTETGYSADTQIFDFITFIASLLIVKW
jgi:hypothetical protein